MADVKPDREQITGLVLAGGQGSRLGGVDKGLQRFGTGTLASNALQRLRPQVGYAMISANRNHATYAQLGVPVWADETTASASVSYEGPLAGFLAGLRHCETPFMVTVPCDCPRFPDDLVQRLADALVSSGMELALAATRQGGTWRPEPAFCLMRREHADDLAAYLQTGQRSIERWAARFRRVDALFDDEDAFDNINTPGDLARIDPSTR